MEIIHTYNSFQILDPDNPFQPQDPAQGKKRNGSRKKKIKKQATEQSLSITSSQQPNTSHCLKKPLNQRNCQSITQTTQRPPSVHPSVQTSAENKSTNVLQIRLSAADYQDETCFSDTASEDEWFDSQSTFPPEDKWFDAQSTFPPEDEWFDAQSTFPPEDEPSAAPKPDQQNPLLDDFLEISEAYYESKIQPYLNKKFKNKNKYPNIFSHFQKLIKLSITELTKENIEELSELLIPLIHSSKPIRYRCSILQFAIQLYTTTNSTKVLKTLGYRLFSLFRHLKASTHHYKSSNPVNYQPINCQDELMEPQARRTWSSLITLYKAVIKEHASIFFYRLFTDNKNDDLKEIDLFVSMNQIFITEKQEALITYQLNTVPIDRWIFKLQCFVEKLEQNNELKLAWDVLVIAIAIMDWVLGKFHTNKNIRKNELSTITEKYLSIEKTLDKAINIVEKTIPISLEERDVKNPKHSDRLQNLKKKFIFCEFYLILTHQIECMIPHEDLITKLKTDLEKVRDLQKISYHKKNELQYYFLDSLLFYISINYEKTFYKTQFIYTDLNNLETQSEVESYINKYETTGREYYKEKLRKNIRYLPDIDLQSGGITSTSETNEFISRYEREIKYLDEKVKLRRSILHRAICQMSKYSEKNAQEEYDNEFSKSLNNIDFRHEDREMEIISWQIVINSPDSLELARDKLKETIFTKPTLIFKKASILFKFFNAFNEVVIILGSLLPKESENSNTTADKHLAERSTGGLWLSENVEANSEPMSLKGQDEPLEIVDNSNIFAMLAMAHLGCALSIKDNHQELKRHMNKAYGYARISISLPQNLIRHAGCLQKVTESMEKYKVPFSDYKNKLPHFPHLLPSRQPGSWKELGELLYSLHKDGDPYNTGTAKLQHNLCKKNKIRVQKR